MTTNWSDKYLNIPFVRGGRDYAGCDCGGLVLLVYRDELGLFPTDFTAYEAADFRYPQGYRKLAEALEGLMGEWVPVEEPLPFDLVRFRYGRACCHVGLYISQAAGFLHVEEAQAVSRVTPLNDLYWGRNCIEFRRYRELL